MADIGCSPAAIRLERAEALAGRDDRGVTRESIRDCFEVSTKTHARHLVSTMIHAGHIVIYYRLLTANKANKGY